LAKKNVDEEANHRNKLRATTTTDRARRWSVNCRRSMTRRHRLVVITAVLVVLACLCGRAAAAAAEEDDAAHPHRNANLLNKYGDEEESREASFDSSPSEDGGSGGGAHTTTTVTADVDDAEVKMEQHNQESGEHAAAARGTQGMGSTGGMGSGGRTEADSKAEARESRRLHHQQLMEKTRAKQAQRDTEEREAAARREAAEREASAKQARLANQRWRTCGASGQPECAYAITLAVKNHPLPLPPPEAGDAANGVSVLRLRAGERSPRLTAAVSHRADLVVGLRLVQVRTGTRVSDSLVTWSLDSHSQQQQQQQQQPRGMGADSLASLRFAHKSGGGEGGDDDEARALRRHFALTPSRSLQPGTYDAVFDIEHFHHPVALTDIAAPEVAFRVEVSAPEEPLGTIEIIPPASNTAANTAANAAGNADGNASPPTPLTPPGTPTTMTMTAHTTSDAFTVRLSRPADLVLRVGSVGPPWKGAVDADPPLLVFRKERGDAGRTLTVRLTPSMLPR
jgi:hypothetical protein